MPRDKDGDNEDRSVGIRHRPTRRVKQRIADNEELPNARPRTDGLPAISALLPFGREWPLLWCLVGSFRSYAAPVEPLRVPAIECKRLVGDLS
jgi:hypothetical protein